MGITNTGRGLIRDAVNNLLTTGGVGLDNTPFSPTDEGLFGGGVAVDSLDSSSDWSFSGAASGLSLNEESGEFLEGTGCLNLVSGDGVGSWFSTFGSTDLSSKKLYSWFYVNLVSDLTDSSSAITVELCDSSSFDGSSTNKYYFSRDELSNGWNSLNFSVDSPDIEGSSLATSDISDYKVSVELDVSQSGNNMRLDYIRYYEPDTLGVTDSNESLVKESGDYYIKTTHNISSTESNGLVISEAGDNNGSQLISRIAFAPLDKGTNTELQIDKYYYIESG